MEKLKYWGGDPVLRATRDGTDLSFEKDREFGFSWPQRNYKCSFCKKEFKSAQALGGHMNVHRRDRARMRLSSPSSRDSPNSSNPNSNPNPNPDPSLCTSPSLSTWVPKYLPNCNSSLFCVTNPPPLFYPHEEKVPGVENFGNGKVNVFGEDKGKKNKGEMVEFANFTRRKDDMVLKENDEFVRFDLNKGLFRDGEEDLDLELRLGYS